MSNAFLHGLLDDVVYMKKPQGYKDLSNRNLVCKLTKSLCGLRQAPRAWYAMLSNFLLQQGFVNSKADPSLLILHSKSAITLVLVYVDDLIITGSDSKLVSDFIDVLSTRFSMKDLGFLSYFLGIEVHSTASGLFLNQAEYAADLLIKAGMFDCKSSFSPVSLSLCSLPQIFFPLMLSCIALWWVLFSI